MENSEIVTKPKRKVSNPLKGKENASPTGLEKIPMDKSMKELQRQRKIFAAKSRYYK